MKRNSAFTLLEMAVVLMVATFLLLLSPPPRSIESTELSFRLFITDFLSQLESAQNYAVITGQAVRLDLAKPIGSAPFARFSAQDASDTFVNRKLNLPAKVTLRDTDIFWIKGGTAYIKPETIVFSSPRETVSIKIQMGNGRYHVDRQKK